MDKPMYVSREASLDTLKAFIAAGGYTPGDRLPAERALMDALGMTRTVLRRALDTLEQEGAIWRHVGKGTFLADESEQPAVDRFADIGRALTPIKVMRARASIEPAIAREAAINASSDAVARIMHAIDGSEAAQSWGAYEAFDDQFHHEVAAASDNMLLVALFEQMNKVQQDVARVKVVRETSRPPRAHTSFTEHRNIAEAIAAHDPRGAHDAMRRHIASVSVRLFEEI